MAQNPLAVTTDYVRTFTALWHTEISWPEDVLTGLASEGLDTLDVLHVLKTGTVVECEKETAHGATMVARGMTCDEKVIAVKFWAEVNTAELKIRSVKRI